MGAADFMIRAKGTSAQDAFKAAVEDARHQHGHGGDTGSIAEKNRFQTVSVPPGRQPMDYARELLERERRHFSQDRYGAAGCIELGEGEYLFFGTAPE